MLIQETVACNHNSSVFVMTLTILGFTNAENTFGLCIFSGPFPCFCLRTRILLKYLLNFFVLKICIMCSLLQ